MTTSHITTNDDVDVTILQHLSLNDLNQFCNSNKQMNHFCHHNPRLQHYIHQTSIKVLNVLASISIGVILQPTVDNTIKNLEPFMAQYDIGMLSLVRRADAPITLISIFKDTEFYDTTLNQYIIKYKVTMEKDKKYKLYSTHTITRKQLKEYLFHLFYDQLFEPI